MKNKNLIYMPKGCIFGCKYFHEYSNSLDNLIEYIKSRDTLYYLGVPFHVISIFNPNQSGMVTRFEYNSIHELRMNISVFCRYRELIVSPKFDEVYEEICYFEYEKEPTVGREENISSFDLGLIYDQYPIPETGLVKLCGFENASDWPMPMENNFYGIGYLYGIYGMEDQTGIYSGLDLNIGCSVYPYSINKNMEPISFEEAATFTIPIALLNSDPDEVKTQQIKESCIE